MQPLDYEPANIRQSHRRWSVVLTVAITLSALATASAAHTLPLAWHFAGCHANPRWCALQGGLIAVPGLLVMIVGGVGGYWAATALPDHRRRRLAFTILWWAGMLNMVTLLLLLATGPWW